jgi:hypothetical protein|tara:strand:+ start:2959 stop:3723 length:765 start_codon:yes stop_codon:yes gene_type:complete
MAEIRDIDIREVEVRDINVPSWMTNQPRIPSAPPVTVQVGVPVIDIPGCVEAHTDNKKGTNDKLVEDDSDGARVFCDGNMPSFNPINFNEEVELPTPKPIIPPYKAPDVPGVPEIPKDVIPKVEKEVECPPPNAPRIGDVAQNQKERVSGFELQNGVCVTLYEDIPFTAQYLPAPQVAATTAGIAVVATSSALLAKPLADLLLKVFKPVIKKVITKISKIRGKKVKIESLKERRDLQRERSRAIRILRRMKDGK